MPYDISEEKRDWYRRVSARSRRRKKAACSGDLVGGAMNVNVPRLRPESLMPRRRRHGLRVLNSRASQAVWERLRIWPNGVQKSRRAAAMFPPENGHFRMSVQDCALLQGFSDDWTFEGSAYQILGQIGNSVCPPVGYAVAVSVAGALGRIAADAVA